MLWVLVIAALVFGVALLALGRGDSLHAALPDRVEPELPGRRLTATDLDQVRLPVGWRGYRMTEVDAVLLRLRQELVERDVELQSLRPTAPVVSAPSAGEPVAVDGPSADDAVPPTR